MYDHPDPVAEGGDPLGLRVEAAVGFGADIPEEPGYDDAVVVLLPGADDAAVPPGCRGGVAGAVDDPVAVLAEVPAALPPAR